MKRILALISVPLVVLALSGCLRLPNGADPNPPAGDNRPSDSATDDTADEAPDDGPASFGDTYTWTDGVSITVSAPEAFTPSEYASFDEAPSYLKFTITLVNDSDEPVSAALVYPSLQSGNTEASTVFDSDQGLSGPPSTDVLPGRETQWAVGFGVSDPTDLVLEISPGFAYDSAYFTNE